MFDSIPNVGWATVVALALGAIIGLVRWLVTRRQNLDAEIEQTEIALRQAIRVGDTDRIDFLSKRLRQLREKANADHGETR